MNMQKQFRSVFRCFLVLNDREGQFCGVEAIEDYIMISHFVARRSYLTSLYPNLLKNCTYLTEQLWALHDIICVTCLKQGLAHCKRVLRFFHSCCFFFFFLISYSFLVVVSQWGTRVCCILLPRHWSRVTLTRWVEVFCWYILSLAQTPCSCFMWGDNVWALL